MHSTYQLKIANLTRELPLIQINNHLTIASFVLLGDNQLTCACAKELFKRLPMCDVFVTFESKGIPLAQELANLAGHHHFVVLRKSQKAYMKNPLSVTVNSITTTNTQHLFLDKNDATFLANKKVILLDDVISTGASLTAGQALLKQTSAEVCAQAAILAEGKASLRNDIIFLNTLPLFDYQGNPI